MRTRLFILGSSSLIACGCSSSSSSSPPAAPPTFEGAPASVEIFEGRTSEVALTVRGSRGSTIHLEPAAVEGIVVEVLGPDESKPAAPNDGLFHGRLLFRTPYGAKDKLPAEISVDAVDAASNQRTKITMSVKAHTLSWKPLSWAKGSGPQTREHGVFMFDPNQKTAFLLQGSGYSPQWVPIEDSWKLDLTSGAWSAWTPNGDVPPPGAARRIASVPGSSIAYVHGGYTGWEETEKTESDLYRLDLTRPDKLFTKLAGTPPESPRQLHAIGYDAKGEQLVIFGGFTSTPSQAILNDTWLVKVSADSDSATWTKLSGKAPSGRYGAFFGFDDPSRRFIVWSGGQEPESSADPVNAAKDAWALDLNMDPPTWYKIAPEGEAPPGRRNGCVMHDPAGRRLFVFGGTSDAKTTRDGLWVLSLEPEHEAWTKLEIANTPHARSSGFGFATPDGGVACGFGNDDDVYSDVNVLGYFD